MESYFEFNVVHNGKHLFATAPRSFPIYQSDRAKNFYRELCKRFPVSEGFAVLVTECHCTGKPVTRQWASEMKDKSAKECAIYGESCC